MESVCFPIRAAKDPPRLSSFPYPHIYAELLINIRQVSIFISLPTPSTLRTRVELSPDSSSVSVIHNGQTTSIPLPAKVVGTSTLKLPATSAKEILFRLPIDHSHGRALEVNSENAVPWSASSLTDTTVLSCRNCERTLVGADAITTWKDLPSENWAEMMNFWHCHKPNEEHEHNHGDYNEKDYSANNHIAARPGLGFVDLCYFLLSEQDCNGVRIESAKSSNITEKHHKLQVLACTSCSSPLGAVDLNADGWRLHKWSIAVTDPPKAPKPISYRTTNFITARLLSLIDSQAVRKFLVLTDDDADGESFPFMIWVFTPDLRFTSSCFSHPTCSKRAMKVFYQPSRLKAANENEVDEVYLPSYVHRELWKVLQKSNTQLPEQVRKFHEWDVGIMERFGASFLPL